MRLEAFKVPLRDGGRSHSAEDGVQRQDGGGVFAAARWYGQDDALDRQADSFMRWLSKAETEAAIGSEERGIHPARASGL